MRIKNKIIFGILIISFLTFSYSSGNLVANDVITDFYYSDHLVPDEELVWDVAKFDTKGQEAEWILKTGHQVEEGDQLKLKITKDPDEANISSFTDLFFTDVDWAEFYLNDVYVTDNLSSLNLLLDATDEILVAWLFVIPTVFEFATGNESSFDYLYDEMEPYIVDNDTHVFDVTLTDDLFTQRYEFEDQYVLFFVGGFVTIRQSMEISYNTEWGILDKVDVYAYIKIEGEVSEVHLILLNENSTQKASIHWATGFIALLTLGLAVGYMRKR